MAGVVKQTLRDHGRNVKSILFNVTADAADGSVPDTQIDDTILHKVQGWFVDQIVTAPGGIAPTTASDLTIEDELGLDILGGNGTDIISATVALGTIPSVDSTAKPVAVRDNLTLKVTNNSVNSATFSIVVVFTSPDYRF